MTPRQLSFDLPSKTAMGREDFYVSPANAMGVAMIEAWESWSSGKLLLIGPNGAGKTHLTHVWASLADARIIPAEDLHRQDIPDLARHNVAIEDVPVLARNPAGEQALFHLHNLVLAEGRSLLLSATNAPRFWNLVLADLDSRMQGTQSVVLERPDDSLLAAVLMKLFADRQLVPTPDTIPYLTRRMDRSFAMAHRVVSALDHGALAQNKPINRALAAQVLTRLTQADPQEH